MKKLIYLLPLLFILACQSGAEENGAEGNFTPVDTNFRNAGLVIPKGDFEYKTLFQERDMIFAAGSDTELAPAKGKHDFMAFIPINGKADHGVLWVNHETGIADSKLGDGGGASILEVLKDSTGGWKVIGRPHAIDFSPVGGTMYNCLGAVTPWGTVLTSEETEPSRNLDFFAYEPPALTDTSDIDSMPRWANYGWMVEVDIHEKKAIRKNYAMGRFMHEGNYCMEDKRTVYMMDDDGPGVFFKFVADKPGSYEEGQLFGFQLPNEGSKGTWIPLPREKDSLMYAREMALKRGASIFIRMEDIELGNNGIFYITETGKDSIDMSEGIAQGGRVAPWLDKHHLGNGVYDDTYGRILTFDPNTNELKVFLEGGEAKGDKSIHLGNPDNLALDLKRNQLVIHEDINNVAGGRVPENSEFWINEIYVLDLSIKNPSLDDLKRLAIAPHRAETTGGVWSPDFSTLFFNLQHPAATNDAPFNRSTTIALTGWGE